MMHVRRVYYLVLIFSLYVQLDAVVIIVHGSFSAKKMWWKPGGYFFKEIEREAKKLGQAVVPFCWSGEPMEKEITDAGTVLAKLIMSYPVQEHIILIGHSHGGNVINYASQLVYDPLKKIFEQMANKPLSEILAQAQAQLTLNGSIAPQNQRPTSLPAQPFHWWDMVPTVKSSVSINADLDRGARPKPTEKKYLIDRVYLLGTPVDTKTFAPQMEVIGSLVNIFSEGDVIQPVFGMYGRHYPLQARLANLETLIKERGKTALIKPGHSKLHSKLIGQWLLFVPDLLADQKLGNFELFAYAKDGKIIFDDILGPQYV
jgi:hypothetical protein